MRRPIGLLRLALLSALVAGTLSVVGSLYLSADAGPWEPRCPVCGTKGVPIPERDQLGHCECQKWWVGSPVRLAIGDCSTRQCQDGDEEPKLIWVDLPLYRCPKDGLLFTEPQ